MTLKRTLIFFIAFLFTISVVTDFSVYAKRNKKSRTSQKKHRKNKRKKDILLSVKTISKYSKKASYSKAKTKLPQIDILNILLKKYRNDKRVSKYGKKVKISGFRFEKAFLNTKHLFNIKKQDKNTAFKSKIKSAKIEYSKFKAISIYKNRKKRLELSINLRKSYTQEIPYTFGAKIKMVKKFKGAVRLSKRADVTEIYFYNDRDLTFLAPGIAFFLPDIFVQIASIRRIGNNTYGYVIGRVKKSPKRFMAVRFNLTTCAKSSIKTYKLSPKEYKRKLRSVSYFGFED